MMDLDPYNLFFSIFFNLLGMAYFSWGKSAGLYFRLAGVGLFIFPYAVDGLFWIIVVGTILAIAPFILEKYFPSD